MEANQGRTVRAERAGECFGSKRESHDHARDWLAFLIDHPDKSVSVREYRAQLKAAHDAVSHAHHAMMRVSRG